MKARARRRKARRRKLVVAGCVAQAEGGEILRRQPAVDVVVGPQNYHRLPELLRRGAQRRRVVDTEFPGRGQVRSSAAPPRRRRCARAASAPSSPCRRAATSSAPSASCPIRAAPRSRARSAKIARRSRAARRAPACASSRCSARTSTPITATTAPAGASVAGAALRAARAKLPGVARLRYTTTHPNDMDDELIAAHADIAELDALSASAGAIGLRPHPAAMNRRHDAAAYLDDRRASARGAAGHRALLRFHRRLSRRDARRISRRRSRWSREVGFACAFSFKYSPRPGTPGGRDRRDQVRRPVKAARLARLQALLEASGRRSIAPRRAALRRRVRKARPARRPDRRHVALYAGGAGRRRRRA